ncbi:hypothetical protein EDD15DRAFT_2521616 [Pisolithus albus]|nr:hypothetical protein EDD15DRAFT_2521616 [Pisolithus albus]
MADGAALRDESRRLDSEKICSMFEGQNHTESQEGTAAAAGESDPQVLDSFGRSIQTDVVDRRDNPAEDTVALKANLVTSPVRDSGPDRIARSEAGEREVSESKTTQKVVWGAQDSKTRRDATAPSDLRVPATTEQNGKKAGPQTAIGGGSAYGPKQAGGNGIAVEVARLSEEER